MALTEMNTEKIPGRITHVYIGYDGTHGVDIKSGIVSFEYWRNKEAKPYDCPSAKTADNFFQQPSTFGWRLRFLSDARVAFFATDVQVAGGNQYAMVDNDFSNEIEYFRVIMPIVDGSGANKTRTFTITKGYALKNRGYIGEDEDALCAYEGVAEYISYSDA